MFLAPLSLFKYRKVVASLLLAISTVVLSGCGALSFSYTDLKAAVGLPAASQIKITQSSGSFSINEGDAYAISFSLSAPLPSSQIVTYAITSTRGDQNADFVASHGSIAAPAGAQALNLIIQTVDDTIYEGPEDFTLTLSSADSVLDLSTSNVWTLNIIDNDAPPVVALSAIGVNVNEGAGAVTVPATLDHASSHPISVNYSVNFGTASAADIGLSTGTVTFAPGQLSQSISIPIVDDAIVEPGETFDLALSGLAGDASLGQSTQTITIIDNDYPSFSIADLSTNEGTTATFTISLSVAAPSDATVDWATADGTGLAGVSYTASSGTATILAGAMSTTITVPVLANANICVADKTFLINLTNATNASIGDAQAVGSIVDISLPTISVAANSVAEGSVGTITATLSQSCPTRNISFNWATSDGTAIAGADYTAVSSTAATILAGATTKALNVTTIQDTLNEVNETLNVILTNPVNVTFGTATAALTINDDDPVPTLSINDVTVNESAGTAHLTVSLNTASGKPVSFQVDTSDVTATAGSDYTAVVAGAGSIPAGSLTTTVDVAITNDAVSELAETFNVGLSAPVNATIADATGVVTITDDDLAPTIAIDSPSVIEGSGPGSTVLTYTVTLSAVSGQAVTINFATSSGTATSGTDFTATSGTLTFTAGQTSKTIDVTINRDALNEADETVIMTLSGGSAYTAAGSTLVGTGTITDDDALPTVQWTAATSSGYESGGALTVTAQLSAASGRAVSIPFVITGTAINAVDYSITASPVTIAAGSTTTTVTITPIDDATVEPDETVILTMGVPTNASASGTTVHTATILNDDLGAFTISGIRSAGGLDVITDQYLNYEAAPRYLFGASAGASSYDVTTYASDGTTVVCALENTALTTFDPAACALTPGSSYKLKVTAKVGAFTRDATNSPFTFTYNRAPVVPARGVWGYTTAVGRVMSILADDPATAPVDPATDADGDTLTISAVTNGSHGTVTNTSSTVTYTSAAGYDGSDSFTVSVTDGRGATVVTTVSVVVYSLNHWTGNAFPDTTWANGGNWCGPVGAGAGACSGTGSAPTSSTVAVFASDCTHCDASVAASASALGIEMRAGYAGTITQSASASMVLSTNGWLQSSGTFVGSNDSATDITVSGNYLVDTGASFTAPRGHLYLGRSGFVNGNTALTYVINGTFLHNNGSVEFNTVTNFSSSGLLTVALLNVNSNVEFYDLHFAVANTLGTGGGGAVQFVDDTDTITVKNNLYYLSGMSRYGNINVEKNLYMSCALVNSCSVINTSLAHSRIHFTGSSNSTYTVVDNSYAAPQIGEVYIEKDTDAVTVSSADNRSVTFVGLNIIKGEFVAPTSTLQLGRLLKVGADLPSSGSTWGFIKSGGIFTNSGGTVTLACSTTASSGVFNYVSFNCLTVNVSSTATFYNLNIAAANTSSPYTADVDVTATADIIVANDFTISDGWLKGDQMKLQGNLIATCTTYATTPCARRPVLPFGGRLPTELVFIGSAAQTYNLSPSARVGSIVLNKDHLGDTVSPLGASYLAAASIEVDQGTLNLPGAGGETRIGYYNRNSTVTGKGLTLAAGGGLINHNSGKVIFDGLSGNTSFPSVIYVQLNGRALALNDVSIAIEGTSATTSGKVEFATGDTLTVANLSIDGGLPFLGSTAPTLPSIDVKGNLALTCASSTLCSTAYVNNSWGAMVQMSGANSTISQAAGAAFPIKRLVVNLASNANTLTLNSNLNLLNPNYAQWANVYMTQGTLVKNGFSVTNINNLDVTAGATCSGALSYVTSSGVTGSGCGP
jgi:hypothetical protein